MKKAMRRYGSPNEIVSDKLPSCSVAVKELGYADKQLKQRQANNREENSYLPSEDENAGCFDLGECTASKNLLQSTPHFTLISIQKGHNPRALTSS